MATGRYNFTFLCCVNAGQNANVVAIADGQISVIYKLYEVLCCVFCRHILKQAAGPAVTAVKL